MKQLSRRSFLRAAALAGAGLAGVSRLRAETGVKTEPSKPDLVRALTGVHNFMITPFLPNYDLDAKGLRRVWANAGLPYLVRTAPRGILNDDPPQHQ